MRLLFCFLILAAVNGFAQTNSCVPPPSGVTLWLPFDETSSTNSANLFAAGNSGTQINGPAFNSGFVANSLCFDGLDDYVEVTDYSAINVGTNDFSVDAWVKPVTVANTVRVIVDHREENPPVVRGYSLFLAASNTVGLQIADGTFINCPFASVVPADGQWHFVAVTVKRDDPLGIKLYVDGVQDAQPRDPTGHPGSLTPSPNYPFRVGSRSSSVSGLFAGCIDEVELFNRELATSEVQGIFNAGSAGKCKPSCVIVVESATSVSGSYNLDSEVVVDQLSRTITVALEPAERYYRINAPCPTMFTLIAKSGSNILLTYQFQ